MHRPFNVGLCGLITLSVLLIGSAPARADATEIRNLVKRAALNTAAAASTIDVTALTTCNQARCTIEPDFWNVTLTSGQVLRTHSNKNAAGYYTSYRRMPSGRLIAARGYTPRTGAWATRSELIPSLRERARRVGLPATGSVVGVTVDDDLRYDERSETPYQFLTVDAQRLYDGYEYVPGRLDGWSNLQSIQQPDGTTLVSWTSTWEAGGCTTQLRLGIGSDERIYSLRRAMSCTGTEGMSVTDLVSATYDAVPIKGPVRPTIRRSALD